MIGFIVRFLIIGSVFAASNIIIEWIFSQFNISTSQVLERIVTLNFDFSMMLIYIPLVVITWGVVISLINRFVRI